MENLYDDIFTIIFQYLEDLDYVRFLMTCQTFYHRFRLMRPIVQAYPVSLIVHVVDQFYFTNVIYDLKQLCSNLLPSGLESLTIRFGCTLQKPIALRRLPSALVLEQCYEYPFELLDILISSRLTSLKIKNIPPYIDLQRLANLKHLDLYIYNRPNILDSLTQLVSLKLHIVVCPIHHVPSTLTNLMIQVLYSSDNYNILQLDAYPKYLRILHVPQLPVYGSPLPESLESLKFSYFRRSDESLPNFPKNLTHLDIPKMSMVQYFWENLSQLVGLKLSNDHCDQWEYLDYMTRLKILSFSIYSHLIDVPQMSHLRKLHIGAYLSMPRLTISLPVLEKLTLIELRTLKYKYMHTIFPRLDLETPQLKSLRLEGNLEDLTFLGTCSRLEHLVLRGTAVVIRQIPTTLTHLETEFLDTPCLDLSGHTLLKNLLLHTIHPEPIDLHLPCQIIRLELNNFRNYTLELPKCLRQLKLEHITLKYPLELPQKLTRLELYYCKVKISEIPPNLTNILYNGKNKELIRKIKSWMDSSPKIIKFWDLDTRFFKDG
jgi:hypothetical protein